MPKKKTKKPGIAEIVKTRVTGGPKAPEKVDESTRITSAPTPKKKTKKPGLLKRFFSAIGGGIIKKKTKKPGIAEIVKTRVTGGPKAPEKVDEGTRITSAPTPKKKIKKPGLLKRFFSAIGGGVIKAGGTRVTGGPKAPEKVDEVTQRLRELKRLETLQKEELAEGRKLEEEKIWEERAELRRPLSERLSDVLYSPLKRPARRLAKFFKGLDEDLNRANIRIPPERYAAFMIGMSLIMGVFAFILMFLFLPIPFTLIGGVVTSLFALALLRTQPRRRAKARVVEVNRVIPYVLRHMATHLSSGIGLPETVTSISKADYRALSEEFDRVIHDMHTGTSMEEALTTMDRRVNSEPLRRAIRQIQRTLRTGGDLANILKQLADETAFEMRMKLRDYTQSLNMLTMIYMFASAVIPAMILVTLAVGSSMGGMMLTPTSAAVLFLVILPVMLFYFVIMIKRFEPRL